MKSYKEQELIVKSINATSIEERNAIIGEYLEVAKERNQLIYKFVEETGSKIIFITPDSHYVTDDGVVFDLDGSEFIFAYVVDETFTPLKDKSSLTAILKNKLEIIKEWVANSKYVSTLEISCAKYINGLEQYETMISLMNNDAHFLKPTISTEGPTFLLVNKTLDTKVNIKMHEMLEFSSNSNFSPQRKFFINLAAMTVWLAKYDIDAGEDCLDDKGSVRLTKEWVECRIQDALILLEAAEVESLTFYDSLVLQQALSHTFEFLNKDDFNVFDFGIKYIKEESKNNYNAEKEESYLHYPGWEETATTVLPKEIKELLDYVELHVDNEYTFKQTIDILQGTFFRNLKEAISQEQAKFEALS